jgi:NhaP-type Na+/H+ or K+/H+ antiporter
LVVALATYLLVVEIGGNGFVAAFVCGVGFGTATRRSGGGSDDDTVDEQRVDQELEFTHLAAQLLGFAVWFVFGESVLGSLSTAHVGQAVVYSVLSLTVLRMFPVALSLLGLHLPWDTVLLAGWLGPRGLASLIFAILAADAIGGSDGDFVLTVIAMTVAISVVAHGLSAGPLARWYAARHPVAVEEVA